MLEFLTKLLSCRIIWEVSFLVTFSQWRHSPYNFSSKQKIGVWFKKINWDIASLPYFHQSQIIAGLIFSISSNKQSFIELDNLLLNSFPTYYTFNGNCNIESVQQSCFRYNFCLSKCWVVSTCFLCKSKLDPDVTMAPRSVNKTLSWLHLFLIHIPQYQFTTKNSKNSINPVVSGNIRESFTS